MSKKHLSPPRAKDVRGSANNPFRISAPDAPSPLLESKSVGGYPLGNRKRDSQGRF